MLAPMDQKPGDPPHTTSPSTRRDGITPPTGTTGTASHAPSPAPSPAPPGARLFAPWRLEYLQGIDGGGSGGGASPSAQPAAGSFLSHAWANPADDDRALVVLRTPDGDLRTGGMIMLNRYPYSNGHLLVALGEARPTLLDYDPPQRAALWALVDRAAALMQRALQPQGINIGINQGRAAGAGVPDHLHVHLVPRWSGDVNFMTTVAHTRVIPASLEAMLARYRTAVR